MGERVREGVCEVCLSHLVVGFCVNFDIVSKLVVRLSRANWVRLWRGHNLVEIYY